MGSTGNDSPSTGSQRSLFEGVGREVQKPEKGERGLSANPNIPFETEPTVSQVAENAGPKPVLVSSEYVEPVWIQRIKLMIFVTFSVWVGMLLVVLPWTPAWGHNNLLLPHPEVRAVFQHLFTRGAASGLGFIDVWIGIWAAVKYHDKK